MWEGGKGACSSSVPASCFPAIPASLLPLSETVEAVWGLGRGFTGVGGDRGAGTWEGTDGRKEGGREGGSDGWREGVLEGGRYDAREGWREVGCEGGLEGGWRTRRCRLGGTRALFLSPREAVWGAGFGRTRV